MLATPHLSVLRDLTMKTDSEDLSVLEGVVAARILRAARVASEQLASLGVRHVLVGALALGVRGHPCATNVVDFLVGDEAFEHHEGGVVTMKPGVPIQVDGVRIDLLSVQADDDEGLREAPVLVRERTLPVAPVEVLVHLKLKSPRMKDASDIVELL